MPTSTTGHSVTPLAVGTAGYTLSYSGAVTPSASQTLNLSVTAAASETVTYLHSDTLGNVIGESKADGTFTRYHYKPYGERVESQPERLGFTGHLHQKELGLTYMQARHYDPVYGRFYANDPQGFDPNNVFSFNRYAYGNNNPFRFTDPDGREVKDSFGTTQKMCGGSCTLTPMGSGKVAFVPQAHVADVVMTQATGANSVAEYTAPPTNAEVASFSDSAGNVVGAVGVGVAQLPGGQGVGGALMTAGSGLKGFSFILEPSKDKAADIAVDVALGGAGKLAQGMENTEAVVQTAQNVSAAKDLATEVNKALEDKKNDR